MARDGAGELLKNKSITVKTLILSGASASSIEYEERHTITTNDCGHFSIVVGQGSSSNDFSEISWSSKAHHLKVEINQGAGFAVIGTVQLQSVPYALHSKTAETATNVTNLSIGTTDISDINSTGATTGSVLKWNGTSWEPGVDEDNAIAISGGAGIEVTAGTVTAKYDDAIWNAKKIDGNAVSASSPAADQILKWNGSAWTLESNENTEYYAGSSIGIVNGEINALNDSALWNANKLNGISLASGTPNANQFLQYDGTSWNYVNGSGGSGGSSLWSSSGSNVYYKSTTGNVGINTDNPFSRLSVFDSLTHSTAGMYRLTDHYYYGGSGTSAQYVTTRSVVIGQGGSSNVAAINVTDGAAASGTGENIGTWSQAYGAGAYNIASLNQTGANATGQSIANFSSARANSTFNVGLYSSADKTNSNTNYGIFAVGDSSTTSYAGYFLGDVNYTGTLTNASDRKLKYDINKIDNARGILKRIEPKSYFYKQDGDAGYLNLSEGRQYGFIAQELELVLPDLVKDQVQPKGFKKEGNVEYKAVNYVGLIPVLTQALKEQQELIEKLELCITELENKK